MNITNQSKVKIVYKGRHSELTELSKQKLKLDLVKKYPNLKDIIIENKGNNDDIKFLQNLVNKEISKDIDTPEFVERLIRDWHKMNNINNVNVEDVVKLNKEIDKETNFKFYKNKEKKEFNIEYIKWDNILSYGDGNEFDFTKLNGITLIKGEPQNQSGKTTFSKHIIEIFLFGSKSQRILSGTIDDVFNNNKDINEAYIEGVFNINNKRYKIERTFYKNKSPKEKINFYLISENGELIGHESLNKDKKVDTQSFIEAITFPHFTKKEGEKDMFFTDFTLIDRYSVEKIIREGDTYRTKNFRNEIGLCNIIEKEEYVKDKFKEKQKTLECVTHKPFFEKYSKDKEEYADKKETINEDIKTLKKNIETLKENKKDLDNEIKTLEKKKKHFDINFDEELKKRKEEKHSCDITTSEKTIKTLKEEIENNKGIIDKKNKEILDIKDTNEDLNKEIEELKNENISIDNEIKKLSKQDSYTKKLFEDACNQRSAEKTILENKLEEHEIELKSLREKRCCSKCGQIIPNVEEKIKEVEEEIRKLTERKKIITKKYNNCVDILKKIEKIESNENLIKEKELSIKNNILQINTNENFIQVTRDVSISTAENKIEEEKNFIKSFINNKDGIKHNQNIDNQINAIKNKIENIQSQLNNKNKSLGAKEEENKKNENDIKNLNEIINKIKKSKETYDIWEKYQKSLGKNGISKIVLNRVINNLNKELSYILRDVCDFDIEIELDDNGDLIFYKTKEGENKISITNAASGFEATISGLALRYLLMKYSKTYQPTFLVLDEINATVAPENQEKLMLLYRRMLEDYSYLMVVTHAETNEDDYDHIIKVTKTNGISSISLEK